MIRTVSRLALSAVLLPLTLAASAGGDISKVVTLDFDDLTVGNLLRDQYVSQGVRFSGTSEPTSNEAGLVSTEGYSGLFLGNSEPNFVNVGLGSVTAKFVNPATGQPATASRARVRMGDGDPNPQIACVNAFDPDGNTIFFVCVHLIEEGTTVTIRRKDIAPARMAEIRFYAISAFPDTGFNMDDFSFSLH